MGSALLWSLLTCLVMVSGNPRDHPRRPLRGAPSARSGNVGAFSAASYTSLGIQPSPRSLATEQKYWWQGPNSPFSPGAAQGQGIAASSATANQALTPSRAVIGCSGNGCAGGLASSFSSSSASGGSSGAANVWWKQQDNPCSTHQGPDCPGGYSCVNYKSCSNGVLVPSSGSPSHKPSAQELEQYGRPCGFSGTEVCCQAPAQQLTVHQQGYQPAYSQPPPAASQQSYAPPSPPSPPPRPPTQPVVAPPFKPVSPPAPSPPAPRPPPPQQPVAAASAPVGPTAPPVPYPGCAAALKCVQEEFCNMEGVMVNEPVFLSPAQKEYRVPLMACLNVETNQVGYCCRDPFYEDPWPGGMMMPGMTKPMPPPPVAPSVVESPAQVVPVVQCPERQECVAQAICASRFGQGNVKNTPTCRNSAGSPGVCCNRAPPPPPPPPPTPAPPPPRPTPPPYYPPASSPPPRRPEQNYIPPPPPTQPVIIPPTTTRPPPPPPPPTLPPTSYLPPPVPPKEPVVSPTSSYVPPPPPAPAAQTADFEECGVTRGLGPSAEVSQGEFPWQGLVMFDNGTTTCSAALIGQKFVLTSAHCVRGINPSSLRVRLGELQMGTNNEPLRHQDIGVSAVMTHPNFEEGSLFNDIALVMLQQPAQIDRHVGPVCLPSAQSTPSGASACVATGWGADALAGQAGSLSKMQVGLVRNNECQSTLQSTHLGKYFQLHQSFVCANALAHADACKVDGGSPLACQRADGRYVLAGLSSWSVGCNNNHMPGVYTDVANMAQWIQSQMNTPEPQLINHSNTQFQNVQQFQTQFSAGAGYGR